MITAHLASATAQTAAQALVPTGKGDPTWFDNPALTQKFVPAILETLMMTGLSTALSRSSSVRCWASSWSRPARAA